MIALVHALGIVAGGLIYSGVGTGPDPNQAYAVPDLNPMTFATAQEEFYCLAPALLLVGYDAFGRTGEGDIYDTLAKVAGDGALEEFYLERVGAMAGGGLEEADQTIHEIKLLTSSVTSRSPKIVIDASWQVIGTVGHAEHLHVRG